MNNFGFYEFFASTKLGRRIDSWLLFLCQQNSPVTSICQAILPAFCGFNKGELEFDLRILPTYMSHMSHSISLKQLNHYFQLYSSGRFRQYDYQERNRKVYNSSEPPDYKLKNFIVPTYIYSGGCDTLVAQTDIEHLKDVLPNVRKYRNFENFNHCDFNYATNSRKILYYDMLQAINLEQVSSN